MIKKIFYKPKESKIHDKQPCICNSFSTKYKKFRVKIATNIINLWKNFVINSIDWSLCCNKIINKIDVNKVNIINMSEHSSIIINTTSINFVYAHNLCNKKIHIVVKNTDKSLIQKKIIIFLYTTKNKQLYINIEGDLHNTNGSFIHFGHKNYNIKIKHKWFFDHTQMSFYDKITGFQRGSKDLVHSSIYFNFLLYKNSNINNVCKISANHRESAEQYTKTLIFDDSNTFFCLPKLTANSKNITSLNHSVKIINIIQISEFLGLRGITKAIDIENIIKKQYEIK